jgi:Aminotransferase class I and II
MNDLRGKAVLITGGTMRIGLATGLAFARQGAVCTLTHKWGTASEDPLAPPEDFTRWRKETAWATSLYEPALSAAPVARTALDTEGAPRPVINLSSYNYLGLVKHPETIVAAQAALMEYGAGACGSPILSGMTRLHRRLEARLSEFLGQEATMLFNRNYSCNNASGFGRRCRMSG